MAAKPTLENSRWGETAAGVVGSNDTAPSSGQRDTGYALAAALVSSFTNRLWREAYLWHKYLSEGILSGPHTFTGGDVEVEDDLQVGGDIGHGEQSLILGPADALVEEGSAPGTHSARELTWPSITNARTFSIALRLKVGDRITTWEVTAPTASGTSWSAVIERVPVATPGSPVALATVPALSGGTQLFGAINHVALADSTYNLRISNAGGGAAAIQFTGARVQFDRTA